jgi:hypothetical protein
MLEANEKEYGIGDKAGVGHTACDVNAVGAVGVALLAFDNQTCA